MTRIFSEGNLPMSAKRFHRALLPLGLAGIIAVATLSGGTAVVAAQKPDQIAAQAQTALKKGKIEQAIALAESAVQGNPREPAYRALLGQVYLKAGRFDSAVTALNDAMTLGDNSARTALGLALANVAAGNNREAQAILNDWRDAIPVSDLGLALALAGDTRRGVAVLNDALRGGQNTPKIRQNLAYAFALDGSWREARMMVRQDVPADQVDARISAWAAQASPEAHRQRVAGLLGTPLRADPGLPVRLALSASSEVQQAAAEQGAIKEISPAATEAPRLAAAPAIPSELPPLDGAAIAAPAELASLDPVVAAPAPAPVAAPSEQFARAFAEAAPVAAPVATPAAPRSVQFVSNPVVQAVPAHAAPVRTAAARPVPARATPVRAVPRQVAAAPRRVAPAASATTAPRPVANGTHLVQLGSFSSQQGARRAWGIYAARNPALRAYKMTITQATVRGKVYYRVAAAGFDAGGARGLCSSLKKRGGACFAYAFRPAAPALARRR
jgi:Flp pilus assembly protein TadD